MRPPRSRSCRAPTPPLAAGPQCPLATEPPPARSAREVFSPHVQHMAPWRTAACRRTPSSGTMASLRHGLRRHVADGWRCPPGADCGLVDPPLAPSRELRPVCTLGGRRLLRKVSPRLLAATEPQVATSPQPLGVVTKYPDSDLWLQEQPHCRTRRSARRAAERVAPPRRRRGARPRPRSRRRRAAGGRRGGGAVRRLPRGGRRRRRAAAWARARCWCATVATARREAVPLSDRGNMNADFMCAGVVASSGWPTDRRARCQNSARSTCYTQSVGDAWSVEGRCEIWSPIANWHRQARRTAATATTAAAQMSSPGPSQVRRSRRGLEAREGRPRCPGQDDEEAPAGQEAGRRPANYAAAVVGTRRPRCSSSASSA